MISSAATGTSKQMQKRVDQVCLDCNKLAMSMRSELKDLHSFSDKCCIYRVPKQLRELNEKACTPQVVSIGPFHHGKQELKAMEEHKKIYLQVFLQQTKVKLKNFLQFIEKKETRLRNCYAEAIELSSEDFARMILLDAAFLILILVKNYLRDQFEIKNDHIFHKPWLIYYARYDICLLENQLPFFILHDLLELSGIVKHVNGCSMIKLAHHFLEGVWGAWVTEEILQKIKSSSEVEHFVDFLRICQKPSDHKKDKSTKLSSISTPCAVELHQAGVTFTPMPKEHGKWKLHDLKFNINTGRLEIPRLKIVDQTEILIRNLQAFEQCHCVDTYIRNYISMINMLVHSTKDVEMLVHKGIIENWLRGNDAVLSLLHNLSIGNFLIPEVFYFSDLVGDLNKFCEKSRNKWKATLKQNYFSNPWAIISVIAAGFLLMLTITQTVCSIIQVT